MSNFNIPPKFFIKSLHLLSSISLAIIIAAIFLFAKDIIFNKGSKHTVNLPIYVTPINEVTLKEKYTENMSLFNNWPFIKDEIKINKGFLKIKFNIQTKAYKTVHAIYTASLFIFSFGIILMVRRILSSVATKNPFSNYNISNLNTITVLSIVSFISMLIYTVYLHWYVNNFIPLDNGKYVSEILTWAEPNEFSVMPNEALLGNFHSYSYLIFALFVFTITQVFKEGMRLKLDNESIL